MKARTLLAHAGLHRHRQRQPRQLGIRCPLRTLKRQRHQAGARGHHAQTELLRHAVTPIGGTDFGNRQAPRGHHHRGTAHAAAHGVHLVTPIATHTQTLHAARLPALHATRVALAQQHLNQVFGTAVAKQLALVLFMKRNAMPLHQRDEIRRGVARERRATEMRVLAEVVLVRGLRVHVAVGEIGPPPARDANFLGHPLTVIQQQHPQTPLTGHTRTKQTSGTCADDNNIKILHGLQCRWGFQVPLRDKKRWLACLTRTLGS